MGATVPLTRDLSSGVVRSMAQVVREIPAGFKRQSETSTVVIASEPLPDRYNDIVAASWELKNYSANPVILLNHSYFEAPVGRALQVELVGDQLVAEIEWDTEDELGAKIAGKFERGFMSTVSVGFRAGKTSERNKYPEDHAWHDERGYAFEENELLEISAVSVPALPSAVAVRDAGSILSGVRHMLTHQPHQFRSALDAVILAAPAQDTEAEPPTAAKPSPEPADWWSSLPKE